MDFETYLKRLPYWNGRQPKFVETLRVTLQPLIDAADVVSSLPAQFDLDNAIGKQLDAVGEWVGRSRDVILPIPGIYFSFNDAARGFGRGVWKGPYDTEVGITQLDDETYRRLLRANILAKRWDGTVPSAQAVFDKFFVDPETYVLVQDNAQVAYPLAFFAFGTEGAGLGQARWYQPGAAEVSLGRVNVSMTIGIAGKTPPLVLLGLLAQQSIPIKPAGVDTKYAVSTVSGAPLFGFGVQNKYVSGFGSGAWGNPPEMFLQD